MTDSSSAVASAAVTVNVNNTSAFDLPGACVAYTDPGLVQGQTVVKAAHLNELRANVLALQ